MITADGARGYPPHAPYDRILSTTAVQQLPYPWVAQTRPGGKILAPWGTAYHNGALAAFTVNGDGSAEGRIVGNVAFMFLRDQRIYASVDDEECNETTARHSYTNVAPYSVAGDHDACLAIGMKVPGCSVIIAPDPPPRTPTTGGAKPTDPARPNGESPSPPKTSSGSVSPTPALPQARPLDPRGASLPRCSDTGLDQPTAPACVRPN